MTPIPERGRWTRKIEPADINERGAAAITREFIAINMCVTT